MDLLGEWGFGYDDAQSFVVASSLRELPDGRWAAKEVGVEEPRQNGKGEILEGRECLGLFYLGERKLIHSAHEFATASEALDRMEDRIGQNPSLKRRLKKNGIKRSHGEEGVYLRDGRSLRYKTRTKGGGRGFSADLLILDEAMYIAEAFLGALMPVISARPNPQMWYTGSAVDQATMDNGVVFSRLRQRALVQQPGRMAYFGWSSAYENNQVLWKTPAEMPVEATADPVVIARANPALGARIDLEHIIVTEREAMSHTTLCVERLGVGDWPDPDTEAGRKIPRAAWEACLEEADVVDPNAIKPIVLAFDVAPDQSSAAIGVAGPRADGRWQVAIIAHDTGDDWVVDLVADLAREHRPTAVMWNKLGEANRFAEELKAEKVRKLTPVDTREMVQACGNFYAAAVPIAREGEPAPAPKLVHIGQPELDAAVAGAGERTLLESWAWSAIKSTADITPLNTVTLALWGAMSKKRGRGSAADVGSLAERAQAQAAALAEALKT